MVEFKQMYTLQQRKDESFRILEKYPDRLPIIVERHKKSNLNEIDKKKYLIPNDLTVGQFMYVIRKRIDIKSEQAIFVFINNRVPPSGALLSSLYMSNKDVDGFLYIKYDSENVFGHSIYL